MPIEMVTVKDKVIYVYSHHLRVVAIGHEYAMLP